METVRQYQQIRSISAEVRYEGGSLEKMARWLGSGIIYRPQSEGDLGSRMEQAFLDSFRERSHRVLLIGSDCPGLDHGKLEQAFETLKRHDLVLGPSFDGGYYLIGIKKAASLLFAGISWGTDRVLSQTHRIAGQIGLKTFLLDPLADIDRPEDLSLLTTFLFPSSPSLSRLKRIGKFI